MAERRYSFTPEADAVLRDLWARGARRRRELAARLLGVSVQAVERRVMQLGIGCPRRRGWSPSEEQFLLDHIGVRSSPWIAKRLGRSLNQVICKAKYLGYSTRFADGYTLNDLAECFGVTNVVILRWLRERRISGAKRPEWRERNPAWHFTDSDVLAFIRDNPSAFDVRRVDQVWFISLVVGSPRGVRPEEQEASL